MLVVVWRPDLPCDTSAYLLFPQQQDNAIRCLNKWWILKVYGMGHASLPLMISGTSNWALRKSLIALSVAFLCDSCSRHCGQGQRISALLKEQQLIWGWNMPGSQDWARWRAWVPPIDYLRAQTFAYRHWKKLSFWSGKCVRRKRMFRIPLINTKHHKNFELLICIAYNDYQLALW